MSILKSNIKIISKLYIEFQRINSTGLSFITSINKEVKLTSYFFRFFLNLADILFFRFISILADILFFRFISILADILFFSIFLEFGGHSMSCLPLLPFQLNYLLSLHSYQTLFDLEKTPSTNVPYYQTLFNPNPYSRLTGICILFFFFFFNVLTLFFLFFALCSRLYKFFLILSNSSLSPHFISSFCF